MFQEAYGNRTRSTINQITGSCSAEHTLQSSLNELALQSVSFSKVEANCSTGFSLKTQGHPRQVIYEHDRLWRAIPESKSIWVRCWDEEQSSHAWDIEYQEPVSIISSSYLSAEPIPPLICSHNFTGKEQSFCRVCREGYNHWIDWASLCLDELIPWSCKVWGEKGADIKPCKSVSNQILHVLLSHWSCWDTWIEHHLPNPVKENVHHHCWYLHLFQFNLTNCFH